MDKYTVDLDKVLNDFEYSELTDNTSQTYPSQSSSTYASSSKSKTGETKHSITNVFHSLNEYLNTDISSNSKVKQTENASSDNNDAMSIINGSNLIDRKFTNNAVNPPIGTLLYLNNDNVNNKLNFELNSVNKTNETIENECEDLLLNNKSTQDEMAKFSDCGLIKSPDAVYLISDLCSNTTYDINDENSKLNTQLEGLLITDDSEITNNESSKMSNEDVEIDIEKEDLTRVSDSTKPNVVGFGDDFELDDTEVDEYLADLEVQFEFQNKDTNDTNCDINNVDQVENVQSVKINENNEHAKRGDVVKEENEQNEKQNEQDGQEEDEENYQYELNNQDKQSIQDIKQKEQDVERKEHNIKHKAQDVEYKEQDIEHKAQDVEHKEHDIEHKAQDVEHNEQDVEHKEPNIEHKALDVQHKEQDVKYKEQDVEYKEQDIKHEEQDTKQKEQDTKHKFVASNVNEENLNQSDGETQEVNNTNIETKQIATDGTADEKSTNDDESIERPTLLQLNSDNSEVPLKREIDLIGNPGSTPYNNVYISKELQSSKADNEESDTCSSASPTFSEASTDAITDSTDTESEDNDKLNKEQSNVNKNVNSNKENLESSESGCVTKENSGECMAELQRTEYLETDDKMVESTEVSSTVHDSTTVSSLPQSQQDNQDIAYWLGKQAPLWIPDSDALSCLHCDMCFTVIKRRHHCRACGLVLCSKCCNLKYKLEYLDSEARVCAKCYLILNRDSNSSSGSEVSPTAGNSPNRNVNHPNPNNPMEYCSVVPPLQQVASMSQNPPTVMVPVGVLKRKGSNKGKSNKSVMFCDGIRPGSDLTKLDTDFDYSTAKAIPANSKKPVVQHISKVTLDPTTKSFIPSGENSLPPTITVFKSDITYTECLNGEGTVETLKTEKLTFALQRNLIVHLKIINMDCCINKQAWCFSTEGLISVGQDEVVYLIETIDGEKSVPVDVFHHINSLYNDAVKGTTVTELGISLHSSSNFLDFKNHAGFLYIRPTFQCLQNIIRPSEPFLIGILIHRWETPWAKIFPLRLVLRLGAEYRYYPSPIISTRHRDSVFVEIGHTIINLLADFRNFSYSLPNIRGLTIHMEDKNTTVTIPINRYDQVMKSLNNSSDHILAFGGNFSMNADSHLVCIQDTQGNNENAYTTHAININNKPRKVTGASFIVFNGALKSSSGLTAKSSIVEDGLMIQIPSEHMVQVRDSLKNMKNHTIQCGCINAPSDETVNVVWGEPDSNFNIGVTSPIDNRSLSGIPSIRVHNGKDFISNSGNRLIRWTEVFILQNTDETSKSKDPIDISKISQSISKATCQALVKYLDLLTSNNFYKIGIRTTLHVENVSYRAGSNNVKLPPIYMKNLDNELIPVLHRITSNNLADNAIVLELIFRILNT